jgi:hypothetical protein
MSQKMATFTFRIAAFEKLFLCFVVRNEFPLKRKHSVVRVQRSPCTAGKDTSTVVHEQLSATFVSLRHIEERRVCCSNCGSISK